MWNWECGYTMRVGILQVWLSYDEGCCFLCLDFGKLMIEYTMRVCIRNENF